MHYCLVLEIEFSKIIIFYGIFDIMPQILLIDLELHWALGIPQCYGLHKLYIYRANLRPQVQKDCAYVNNVWSISIYNEQQLCEYLLLWKGLITLLSHLLNYHQICLVVMPKALFLSPLTYYILNVLSHISTRNGLKTGIVYQKSSMSNLHVWFP